MKEQLLLELSHEYTVNESQREKVNISNLKSAVKKDYTWKHECAGKTDILASTDGLKEINNPMHVDRNIEAEK